MSKEFIERKHGSQSLDLACRQQKQLKYFTTSEIQEDDRIDYFEQFVDAKYYTNDVFLNWVKGVLKTDNFLSFYKYYRNPNPASKIVNTRIKEPLSRVFFSEDNYFNYIIDGKPVDYPEELDDNFEEKLFNAILFRYNDIIVHDLKYVNKPYRKFIDIDCVVSIKVKHNKIKKIAYTGAIYRGEEKIKGYVYIDDKKYEFYNKDLELELIEPHDFGQCPATFIVNRNFGNDQIVKESIFTYQRGDLEEYTFLKTLQRMTHTNGAFPIVTQIEAKTITSDGEDFDNDGVEPMNIEQLGSQVNNEARGTAGNGVGTNLQPGTVISVPPIEKADGSIDMELSKNFFTFYHTPVDVMEYVNNRITELENDIIISAIGTHSERNDVSMTELQTKKGFVSMEDKLRWFSNTMSWSRQQSDTMMLSLKHGKERVKADIFYGSDFFMQTESTLYDMFQKSPNAVERKNILTRLAQRRNMYNKEKARREVILYKVLPYSSDKEFELAVNKGVVDDVTFELQSRFNYWISRFESFYGNIEANWRDIKGSDSEKLTEINNLIINLIKTDKNGKETSS